MTQKHGGRTELDDLDDRPPLLTAIFTFTRDARLFTRKRSRLDQLEQSRKIVPLAPDQILHPPPQTDAVIRRGKLRVSEFLADGREVTRAVLQAGAVFCTRPIGQSRTTPLPADGYNLADIVLTSLGDGEAWLLPAGTLDAGPS